MKNRTFIKSFLGLAVAGSSLGLTGASLAKAAGSGLDSLDEGKLITELVNQRMETLLEREFSVHKTPKAKRDAYMFGIKLAMLNDPKLTAKQRQELVSTLVGGIEHALPLMDDPQQVLNDARRIVNSVVVNDVSTLEYWGDNPKTQQQLQGTATVVMKMLEKAQSAADKKSKELQETIQNPKDPRIQQVMALEELTNLAKYEKNMSAYYLALALDPADPRRKSVPEAAIKVLKDEYDNPESNVQPAVRMRIAKLNMVKGDYVAAKQGFAVVAKLPPEKIPADVKVTPDIKQQYEANHQNQQYEAHYFTVLCDVLAKNPAGARVALATLENWQKQHITEKGPRQGAEAASTMLRYRIFLVEKKENEAINVLLGLVKERPELRPLIFQLILERLPEKPDLVKLNPLMLEALLVKAEQEAFGPKKPNESIDKAVIQRGVDAGREIMKRRGALDGAMVSRAGRILPGLLDKLDRQVEAAEALLDFVTTSPGDKAAPAAMDSAQSVIGGLLKDKRMAAKPEVAKVYERFLGIAVNPPYGKREFAFDYAFRMLRGGKPEEAMKFFRLVPDTDRNNVQARFLEMVTIIRLMEDKTKAKTLTDAERAGMIAEVLKRAEKVKALATAAAEGAKDNKDRLKFRSMAVNATLTSAGMHREQKNQAEVLKVLEGVDEAAKGLPDEKDDIARALFYRVQAYMALGKNTEATTEMVQLMKRTEAKEAASIVMGLLNNLNMDYDKAQAAGDKARMKELAANRGELASFMIDFSRKNPGPENDKNMYLFSRFQANTYRLAAILEDDEAKKKEGLQKSLELYKKLQSDENFAIFQKINPQAKDPLFPDVAVLLGIGQIAFDIGDYKEAQLNLGKLAYEKKLGTPEMVIEEAGTERVVENETYWEVLYKLMYSNAELAKANTDKKLAADTTSFLMREYIKWGDKVGGKVWRDKFEDLRNQLAPGWTPTTESPATPSTQPAGTPVAEK